MLASERIFVEGDSKGVVLLEDACGRPGGATDGVGEGLGGRLGSGLSKGLLSFSGAVGGCEKLNSLGDGTGEDDDRLALGVLSVIDRQGTNTGRQGVHSWEGSRKTVHRLATPYHRSVFVVQTWLAYWALWASLEL